MIAFRMRAARQALQGLEPETRALLDLSLRRGLEDEDIASVLRVEPEEVVRRRNAGLDSLASDLGVSGRDQRDELFATLPDLPPEYWRGDQAARA
jgi:DNA-directed RNA polymerase specialized sigma24 family protein